MNSKKINASDDIILDYFGNNFMDDFHDYPYKECLWRYQHRCRINVLDEYLAKYCKKNMIGIDAGSGNGPSSVIMSNYIEKIFSIEYEKKNVERQSLNLSKLRTSKSNKIIVTEGDITSINHPDNSIDVITCSEVLEHIEDYEYAAVELHRVLKPEGIIIFSMPNKLSAFWQYDRFIYFLRRFVRKLRGKSLDFGGYSYWEQSRHWEFSSKKIRKIAKDAGFTIMEERGLCIFMFNEWIYRNIVWGRFFNALHRFEIFLGKKFPRLCSIYYLVLTKEDE